MLFVTTSPFTNASKGLRTQMGQSGSWTKKSFREESFSQKLTKGKLQNTAIELLLLVLQDPAALTGNIAFIPGTNTYV